ncbi:MAG: succinyl-diaminopimelate desuccinylase [Magnetococcales bacterium]|nr:succinyl-diaminopimelate desuccinylase [Magnetococcales bacterium]
MDVGSPLPLLRALLRVASITPRDNGCQEILINRLTALGFTVHRLKYGSVENFYARLGTTGRNFCFAGHTDVVPVGDPNAWQADPFQAEIHDGLLYGRGVVDMKGGIAAMVAAVEQFLANRPDFIQHDSLSFLITGDEEGDAIDGTVKVLDWLAEHNETLDLCLVGEPSNARILGDAIKNGRRGSVNGEITIHGIQGHVAYPHLANNPLHAAFQAFADLAAIEFDTGNESFSATSFQFTWINSGDGTTNVIPADLKAGFNIRFNTEQTAEGLESRIRDTLSNALAKSKTMFDLEMRLSGLPFLSADGALLFELSEAIEEVTGQKPERSTGGGTSDARFISQVCPQTVEFGLVGRTMHKVNECAPVEDIENLSRIYYRFLERLFI